MDFDEANELSEDVTELAINEEILLFEQDTSTQYKSLKDAVIFLIDCNKSLVENTLHKIMAVAESFLKTKIITNENDLFGLITYNTMKTNNNLNFEGINIIISLTAPDAKLIKDIKILSQNTNPLLNKNHQVFLKNEFPVKNGNDSLNEALWICHQELKNYESKDFNRRIFLFTDNDNPIPNNETEKKRIIQRAKDMQESDIIIELFPMNINKNFNIKKFFCEIIQIDMDANDDLMLGRENCDDRLRELTKRIRQKEIKKRTLGKCPFYLTKDVKFQVNFYATIKSATKPRSYNIDARTNKTLIALNQPICKETGQILYQNQIGTFHNYGGTKIPFSKEEMKKIKTIDNPGLKLMGFKSYDKIKPYHNIRESYFIYPDDFNSSGSSQLCDALIKQMISKNRVAIVKFVPREGANIRFCALIPQKEIFDEDLFQTPPGFNLIFLPFADEIRSNSDIFSKIEKEIERNALNLNDITEEQKITARKLIKKMNIDFDSRSFENPTLQKFLSTLQALALGEGELEKVDDLINPDEDGFKKLNEIDKNFDDLFFNNRGGYNLAEKRKIINDNDDDVSSIQSKRKIINEEKKSVKKAKLNYEDIDDEKLISLFENGLLNKMTVSDLKEICIKKKLKVLSKDKKQDLIDKLIDCISK